MYTIILPAYNEEEVIGKCIREVKKYNPSAEIIVVSDGSTDRTSKIAEKLGVRLLDYKTRQGKGISIVNGIKIASYERIMFMDADLQYSPKDVPKMIKLLDKYDLVVANRLSGPKESTYLRLAYIPFAIYFKLPRDSQAGFKAFRKSLTEKIHFKETHVNFDLELIIKSRRLGAKIGTQYVDCYERAAGTTKIIPVKSGISVLKYLVKMVFDRSL